jgi:ABC-type uncharacterized transport system ATPase subunit
MRDAFIDHFGDQLTQEQLDAIAVGVDAGEILGIAGVVLTGAGLVLGMCALIAV